MVQHQVREASFALFKGAGNQEKTMYLVEVLAADSERRIQEIAKQINQEGEWGGLGEYLGVITRAYEDDGNGSFRRAEQEIKEEALGEFSLEYGRKGKVFHLGIEVRGRRMIRLNF